MKVAAWWLLLSAVGLAQAPAWTLARAESAALQANPSAAEARQQVVQADARLQQAQAQRHAQLSLTTAVSGANADVLMPPPPQETFYTFSNSLTLSLPVGARPGLAVAQADAQLAAAHAQGDVARHTLASQVATAWFDVLRDQALLEVARQTEAEAQRQLEDARQRQRAGDVPQLDVIRAEVPVTTGQSSVLAAANTLHVAQLTLNDLVGVEVPDLAAGLVPASVPWTLVEAETTVTVQAPEVQAAAASVRAQEAAVAWARRWHTPTVTLSATDLHSSDVTAFGRADSVQAQAIFPLTDAGLGQAELREAQAGLVLAQAQLAQARRAARLNAETAWSTAQTLITEMAVAQTAQDGAQTALDKTRLGYRSGLFPLTDVLAASAALTQARLAAAQVRYDAAAAVEALRLLVEGVP